MKARDSAGRYVSLLNEESISIVTNLPSNTHYASRLPFDFIQSQNNMRSNTSSPVTPGLSRADSCDRPLSPATPTSYRQHIPHLDGSSVAIQDEEKSHFKHCGSVLFHEINSTRSEGEHGGIRQSLPLRTTYDKVKDAYNEPIVYDEDSYFNHTVTTEHAPKRYPCRYRDLYQCHKTFTTSGHASRHSKIHTAEKGISCTWPGCSKKFTRSDNMKQHLETHTKERLRVPKPNSYVAVDPKKTNNICHQTVKSSMPSITSTLTIPACVEKKTSCSKRATSRSTQPNSKVEPRSRLQTKSMLQMVHPQPVADLARSSVTEL